MNTALLGLEATAGFSASALSAVQEAGLNFVTIPAGTYEIGAKDQQDNPVRRVTLDAFELADTVLTNRQMAVLMNKLQEKTTIVTATLPNHQAVALACGTKAEIKSLSCADLRNAAEGVVTTGHIFAAGGFATFGLSSVMQSIRMTALKHHLEKNFEGDDQPALVRRDESNVIAALLGVELPIDEKWEAAAGDLRYPKYFGVKKLRRVAHFYEKKSKQATEDVKSREPNQYGLYGMLGNVWEWMANLYGPEDREKRRSLRGGSWLNGPEDVRAAVRYYYDPHYWYINLGVRLSRPQDSLG